MESDDQIFELSQIKDHLRQQQATLDLLKKRRAKSPSPLAQLQQALEGDEEEEIKQCVAFVVRGLETRIADRRLGDKDPTYFKFADQLRAAKRIKAAGGDSEVAEAWAKLRADTASEGRPKRPFRKGAGSLPFFASANSHLQQQQQLLFFAYTPAVYSSPAPTGHFAV
uniref:Uncharacterized protein n=1 Tax=Plectus sambesii TaxID=2011161 RepID=A0A914W5K6_9BILA